MQKEAYDDISQGYDRFVNWEERLSVEQDVAGSTPVSHP